MGSSCQLNYEEIQYLTLLLGIIEAQNWQALGYAILNNPAVFQSFSRTITRSSELNGMTFLHACVRHNPPHHIVKILLALVPEAPSCVDCLQRTPLHVAAGTRARLPVIELLAEAYPTACGIRDKDGKTPLHLACDASCELFEGDARSVREPPCYEVIQTLLQASPSSVPVEDHEGMSALEYAIFSDASMSVVKLLQYATKKQCETRRESGSARKKSRPSYDSEFLLGNDSNTAAIMAATKGGFSRRKAVRSRTVRS